MNTLKTSSYRPEIDGLRSIAVIAVILNHFNEKWLIGGYLGVDIFFVISGFVITSSLTNHHSETFIDFLTGFDFDSLVLCRSSLWENFQTHCSKDRLSLNSSMKQVYTALMATAQKQKNIYVFNLFDLLCPENQPQCLITKNNTLMYRDKDHLNSYGAASLAPPFIAFLRHNKIIDL